MENNYFYDLPEDLQQMIYEKEHKMKMQDVIKAINNCNKAFERYLVLTIVDYEYEYGKDYTRNLVGKDMWDFCEYEYDYEYKLVKSWKK